MSQLSINDSFYEYKDLCTRYKIDNIDSWKFEIIQKFIISLDIYANL